MTTQPQSPQTDFRERARANDVAVARLIGFNAERVGDGRAHVTLDAGPQHANPMGTLHAAFSATLRMLQWEWPLQALWGWTNRSPQSN